jgi:O-antigen ligase
VAAVTLLIAATTAAFGSVYLETAIAAMIGCAAVAILLGLRPADHRFSSALDRAVVVLLAAIAVQAIPLPGAVVQTLSPHALDFHETLIVGFRREFAPRVQTLSIAPRWTLFALALMLAASLVFWTVRGMLATGGALALASGLAWTGAVAAVLAIAQQATAPHLLYWTWTPVQARAEPYGPFVNQNHYATWMLMCIPLTAGLLMTSLARRHRHTPHATQTRRFGRWAQSDDLRWLAFASVMALSLFLSTSRGGLLGLGAAVVFGFALSRTRIPPRVRRTVLIYAAAAAVAIAAATDWTAVIDGIAQTFTQEGPEIGRWVIWRDTLPVVRDFWATGTGSATYERAMLVYQQALRGVAYYNQAHSQYLQVAAEGGLLLAVPTAVAVGLLARLVRRRLSADDEEGYWVRAGAATAIVAVAVQSVWETGLRMPANAIFFAVVCAIATHRREGPRPEA